MSIYLNNAATTWPKPSRVARSMADFLTRNGANLGRGTSSDRDLAVLNEVMDCRIKLADLFGGWENRDPRYVTFCANVTEALNVVLKGFLRPGMRVVSSGMEHNAVVRPLRSLERKGVGVEFLNCSPDGTLDPEDLGRALAASRCDLVILAHASNVCGTIQPLEEIAAVCRAREVPLVLDSAQTAGVLPFDAEKLGLAALCFTGHKGLMGPQGIGGIVWRPDFARRTASLIEGGTGSYSHVEYQPSDMPDKFESGTPNLPGIAGLFAALSWLEETGIETIRARERELGQRLLDGLKNIDGSVSYGKPNMQGRLPVFSLNFAAPHLLPKGRPANLSPQILVDNGILADELSRVGFETRPGLHCAPIAHKTLGSFPHGSLRVSPGCFNTSEEIDAFLEAVVKCTRKN